MARVRAANFSQSSGEGDGGLLLAIEIDPVDHGIKVDQAFPFCGLVNGHAQSEFLKSQIRHTPLLNCEENKTPM